MTKKQPVLVTYHADVRAGEELHNTLNDPNMYLTFAPSPDFVQMMERIGIARRGHNAWAVSVRDAEGKAKLKAFIKEYVRDYPIFSIGASPKWDDSVVPTTTRGKNLETQREFPLRNKAAAPQNRDFLAAASRWGDLNSSYKDMSGREAQIRSVANHKEGDDVPRSEKRRKEALERVKKETRRLASSDLLFGEREKMRGGIAENGDRMIHTLFHEWLGGDIPATSLADAKALSRTRRYYDGSGLRQTKGSGEGCDTNDMTFGIVEVEPQGELVWLRMRYTEDSRRFTANSDGIRFLGHKKPGQAVDSGTFLASVLEHIQRYKPRFDLDRFVLDNEETAEAKELLRIASESILIRSDPDAPAGAFIFVGDNVPRKLRMSRNSKYRHEKISMKEALRQANRKGVAERLYIHDALIDIKNMTDAKPYTKDARLTDIQKEAVGLHLSTNLGYLQACEPGMGKTVIQLTAMRERARHIPRYRGLVAVETNLPQQWTEEAQKWFPEARVVTVLGRDNKATKAQAAMREVLDSEEDTPVVVIMANNALLGVHKEVEESTLYLEALEQARSGESQESLRSIVEAHTQRPATMGKILLGEHWHDLCSDEGTAIRAGKSKQYHALWALRENSDVATVLTGTPYNSSADDLGRLLSWVRNTKSLFRRSLARSYQVTDASQAKKMFENIGPLIFRRTISEGDFKMPEVGTPEVINVKANPAESSLIFAAEKELRRCYLELLEALETLEAEGNADAEEVAAVKEEFQRARGAWLGGTTLARMAASDPTCIQESASTGAALLMSQGLVEAAVSNGSSKQRALLASVKKKIAQGKQALVFTEFSSVAHKLVDALNAEGIKAAPFTGQNAKTRDDHRIAFQNEEIDVLVLTSAGKRGLTLHKASVLYHFDLPWTVESLVQRTGRMVRFGSAEENVEVCYLIMDGTVEQRMSEHLVTLAMESSYLLDYSRQGVDMSKTNAAVKGLIKNATRVTSRDSFREFGKILGITEDKPAKKRATRPRRERRVRQAA